VISVEEAQAHALKVVRRVGAERIAVRQALGRILAEEIEAPGDLPPHDDSAMDGFAVRASERAAERRIVGEAAAGHPFGKSVGPGEAVRIMTGAPLPEGADAVVMVEHAQVAGESVTFTKAIAPGDNVRRRGEDLRAGQLVLRPGDVLEEAQSSDLIVTSGGVSVGEHDHVKRVLDELGGELSFWRVDMKPGKPVAVARLGQTPFYGLPGNPVSSLVSFLLFVRPAIRAAMGATRPFDLPRATAQLARPLKVKGERRSYLRATCAWDGDGRLRATLMPRQGSHLLTSILGANAFVVVEPGSHDWPENATVTVQLFRPPR
jgi:molybdopterin molybdotransferase